MLIEVSDIANEVVRQPDAQSLVSLALGVIVGLIFKKKKKKKADKPK